jgi:hypothetical protein
LKLHDDCCSCRCGAAQLGGMRLTGEATCSDPIEHYDCRLTRPIYTRTISERPTVIDAIRDRDWSARSISCKLGPTSACIVFNRQNKVTRSGSELIQNSSICLEFFVTRNTAHSYSSVYDQLRSLCDRRRQTVNWLSEWYNYQLYILEHETIKQSCVLYSFWNRIFSSRLGGVCFIYRSGLSENQPSCMSGLFSFFASFKLAKTHLHGFVLVLSLRSLLNWWGSRF